MRQYSVKVRYVGFTSCTETDGFKIMKGRKRFRVLYFHEQWAHSTSQCTYLSINNVRWFRIILIVFYLVQCLVACFENTQSENCLTTASPINLTLLDFASFSEFVSNSLSVLCNMLYTSGVLYHLASSLRYQSISKSSIRDVRVLSHHRSPDYPDKKPFCIWDSSCVLASAFQTSKKLVGWADLFFS